MTRHHGKERMIRRDEPTGLDRLFCLGIDQKTPLALREKATAVQSIRGVLDRIHQLPGIEQPVILLTCQRVEVFALAAGPIDRVLKTVPSVLMGEGFPEKWVTGFRSRRAVDHLFRVSCGLESMALGEEHVLGQVKKAWTEAHQAGCCGKFMHQLFKRAITLGKRCRRGTCREDRQENVGTLAVRLMEREMGEIRGKSALVIGRGEMGRSVIRSLAGRGVEQITVVRRRGSGGNSEHFPGFQGSVISSEEKYRALAGTDLVVSVTDAPHCTLEYQAFRSYYTGNPLLIVDLAIPRDIDPRIGELPGVKLLTLEDLKRMGFSRQERDQNLVSFLEDAVEAEVRRFTRWSELSFLDPVIQDWYGYAQTVCRDELSRLECVLENLPEPQRQEVLTGLERVGRKLVNYRVDHLKVWAEEGRTQ